MTLKDRHHQLASAFQHYTGALPPMQRIPVQIVVREWLDLQLQLIEQIEELKRGQAST